MNFKELYIKGMLAQQKLKEVKDNEGPKRYRGGNTGILIDGIPTNSCARKLIARANGRFEETDWNTQLMFDIGELNENRWHTKLEAAGLTVVPADDRVSASCKQGTPVTGSPDTIVVEKGEDSWLIEHKHISSFWTFRDKVFEGNPSLEHVAQAAFYAMHLNLPFSILYTSSVKFVNPGFYSKFPQPWEPGSELIEYTYYTYSGKTFKNKRGETVKSKSAIKVPGHLRGMYPNDLFKTLEADVAEARGVIPAVIQYDCRFTDGVVEYKHNNNWVKTIVTQDNIMDFFNATEEAEATQTLPERPLNLSLNGEPKGFNLCDYCSLSEVCDRFERDYETWLREAKAVRW